MSECTKTSSTILDIENDLKKVEKKEKIHEQNSLYDIYFQYFVF
jgi:hypothetical protein